MSQGLAHLCNMNSRSPGEVQFETPVNLPIASIKGPDLINTPLPFYNTICSSMNILDGFADDLFRNILGVDVSLSELPYPASSVIYFALRWKMYTSATAYGKDELNALFRAFFWRNVLTSRYDQGFLTQFSIDLRKLEQILDSNHSCWGTPAWISKCNSDLDALFGASYPLGSASWIKDTLLDEDTRGALRQLYIIFVKSITKHDIVNNLPLDWGTTIKQYKVQMHHLFPQAWCGNNKGSHQAILQYGINHIANLCPLQAQTNNVWKANSPSTAILSFGIMYANNTASLSEAFIDTTSFQHLSIDDVEQFWPRRADSMANLIYARQFVR